MGDAGTTATTMPAPHHARFEHDDPLPLHEYGLSELRASMASFSDFPSPFGPAHAFGTGPGSAYDPSQPTTQPALHDHRGSIVDMDDGTVSVGSAHPHRPSIDRGRDGSHTSPESAAGLGMLLGDAMDDASLAMKLEGGMLMEAGDAVDGSANKGDSQDPPPWSEMKTKAGKERKRLPLACIACRRKKIRCSGEKPACKHCLRSRIPCVYKVTTRKAAPRTDYMAMLDKRLRRMEDRVIKLIPKESLPYVAGVGRSVVKPALPGAPPKTSAASKKRGAEEAFGNDLDEWAKSRSANPDASGSASRNKESDDTSLLTEGIESLPPKDIQEHLAEVYFDYVYGQSYPLLHKPSFLRRLAKGDVPPVLILAICAISARFSTHPQLRSEPCFLRGDNWGEKAREIALRRYDAPNITILIVYLLLGLHEFGTCQGGRSWMFGGMAQRMAYALQLHKECEYDPSVPETDRKPLSLTDREIRRRTMWSCFLMDRFNSSGTDRPLFVHEQYIEVQLPVKEHLYVHEIQAPTEDLEGNVPNPVAPDSGQLSDPHENMGVTAYTIRLVCIWGKLVKYMNLGGKEREPEPMWAAKSTFHIIKKDAKEFKDALPEMLAYSPENLKSHAIGRTANSYLYLHILYQQIILFLHRFSLPSRAGSRPPKEMPHDFLTESARTALDAANQISILINEAMDHNVVAPFAGYSAFFSSTVHVHGVFSKNPKLEAQSKKYLAYNVKYLSKMKKFWGMFHYIAENLKELYRQHADAQLRGPGAAADKSKAVIFQYGDWFDRYPHGVSKIDYEDAAEPTTNEPGTDAALGQKSDLQSVEEFFASLSPPTRAETQRKQSRKKQSKSVSKADAPNANHAASQHCAQPLHPGQLHQQLGQININPQEAIEAFDPSYFAHTSAQQYMQDYPHAQHNLAMLNTSPATIIHPGQQLDLSPFPDLTPHASNASFWGIDPTGMSNNFFDPGNAGWFLPFNVEPPVLGDDGGMFNADAFNFGLGGGTPVGLGLNGHPPHRQSVSHGHGLPTGLDGMDGLDGTPQ